MSRPLAEADILFPSSQHNINAVLAELKRSNLSISNRLRSIDQDARFVERVAGRLRLPLVANERCGSWYIEPTRKAGSAYFKSTDGHHGQWSFSLRRLNLHLLELISINQGCIIVDSTRRGKSMPDALSKTVPIWICVLNRLVFPEAEAFHSLQTPSTVVSASEHSQIAARLDDFVSSIKTLALDIEQLRSTLQRPMKPYWVTPDSQLDCIGIEQSDSWPVILCTASSRVSLDIKNDSSYVQGAADDHESWAHGLTPLTFWAHGAVLLDTAEDDLPAKISEIVEESANTTTGRSVYRIKPVSNLLLTNNAGLETALNRVDAVVYCAEQADVELELQLRREQIACLRLSCGGGKTGSRQLRTELNKLDSVAEQIRRGGRVLCSCQTGKDLAVGVVLSLLCKYYSAEGQLQDGEASINKTVIKQKLSWIVLSMPDAAPSRATLQSVNAFLMS